MAESKKKEDVSKDNLRYYELLRKVPAEALKPIQAGRIKGFSDVNPVYRIKALTEAFGPCGIGWKYEITKQWQEIYGQEVKSFTNINLYVKVDGQWSEPIPGTGGATIVEISKNGMYVSDEGYKMSLTDALSVAMKSLGVAADIYYSKDPNKSIFDTKYSQQEYLAQQTSQPAVQQQQAAPQAPANPPTLEQVLSQIQSAMTKDALMALWNANAAYQGVKAFRDAMTARRMQIEGAAG